MAPNDLRERPLTVPRKQSFQRHGPLSDAIRKVSPRLFGDYSSTPPPAGENIAGHSCVRRRRRDPRSSALVRVDCERHGRNGRAIAGMRTVLCCLRKAVRNERS